MENSVNGLNCFISTSEKSVIPLWKALAHSIADLILTEQRKSTFSMNFGKTGVYKNSKNSVKIVQKNPQNGVGDKKGS